MEHYDAIVIGAGQAGVPLAAELARAGRRTALIEREHVGGTCINEGCTPTKTMVASARVAYLARRSPDYGVHSSGVSVTMSEVRQRKRAIVEQFRGGSERRLEQVPNLELIRARAAFTGPGTIEVSAGSLTRTLTAATIFINAGARPSVPAIPGIPTVRLLDSTSIMELDQLPEHLVVLGGGYIGLEFGQMFRRFGARVTIIQRNAQLLPHEDADVAEAIRSILEEDGIEVLLGSEGTGVARTPGGGVAVEIRKGSGPGVIRGSHLLGAVGRTPNTDSLNLAAAGIATGRGGFIRVNERLETNVPGVYALGDINGGPAFTHISYDDFRIIKVNLLEGGSVSTRQRLLPYTVYIDPQLGRVGLSEAEAREAGRDFRVVRLPMSSVARALETDESRGFMKAIIDRNSGQILGCAVLGVEGGEIMSMIQLAMMGNLTYDRLRDGIFAHPTLAESLNNLFS